MTGRVDEIQLIDFAVAGGVIERDALRLDGDAALFFQIHRVEHLLGHFTRLQSAANLDQTIRQRRLAVINVRDDGEIADVPHVDGH